MASVSLQRQRRLERKFPLTGDEPEVELSFCDPAAFDQLEASGLPLHRASVRSVPDYAEEA